MIMLICDKCEASISEGSQFCPQCGDPVTDADLVILPTRESQVANVEISFGQSSSSNFNKAVEICQNIPSYSVIGEGKQIEYKIILPITEVDLIINLYELIGSWKSSKMLINGSTATKKDLIYHGVGCYRNRQKAYKPNQFCFGEKEYEANIWGCKKLNMPIYEWGAEWLDYGNFDRYGIWHIDKDRIKHELELALKENELCPVLDRRQVLQTLDKFPTTIDVKRDKNWEYITNYEKVNGEYKEVAIGIKPIIRKINKYVIGEFKPTWEINNQEENINNKNEIIVNISPQNEVPKRKKLSNQGLIKSKKNKPEESYEKNNLSASIWLVVGAVVILYLLLK